MKGRRRTVAGLFAGIGGLEVGLSATGFESVLLCERDESAKRVLSTHFPAVPVVNDIHELHSVGQVDVICAGFPCQDLSQAGLTAGISGEKSGTVQQVFRLLDNSAEPEWIIFENVPFMLHLDSGHAMDVLTRELEKRKYKWAYRIVNAQAFGLPQRRRRVIILASKKHDPRAHLLATIGTPPEAKATEGPCGFYWTEGNTGLGWAVNAIPTLKGGSSIGIPSPPAIWIPKKGIFTPDIRDAERLQGFDVDWTSAASLKGKAGARWKLVGNAVPVPVGRWVGECLGDALAYDDSGDTSVAIGGPWPKAGWGARGKRFKSEASEWPVANTPVDLATFLNFPLKPLSASATAGFEMRITRSTLKVSDPFIRDVRSHLKTMRSASAK